jgi:hypothetical protein
MTEACIAPDEVRADRAPHPHAPRTTRTRWARAQRTLAASLELVTRRREHVDDFAAF